MYIRNTAADTSPIRRLQTPGMDEPVTFNDDGIARVTRDVGEHLANEFDHIEVEREEGNGGDTLTDDEPPADDTDDVPSIDEDDTELQPSADESVDDTGDDTADEFQDAHVEETD